MKSTIYHIDRGAFGLVRCCLVRWGSCAAFVIVFGCSGQFAFAQEGSPFDQYRREQAPPPRSQPFLSPDEEPGRVGQPSSGTQPPLNQSPRSGTSRQQRPGMGPPRSGYGTPPPPRLRDYSLIHIDEPEVQAFKVNDIVTVIVSEKSEVVMNSRFNRQRNSTFSAELAEFVRLNNGQLENAASTSPSIDGKQQERLQTSGQLIDAEGITYRIAATIVDIRPNGNIVLEAHKRIDTEDDVWEYTLHGEVRFEDVSQNNTILSENIANLSIEKNQKGRVYSSVSRRWGTKLMDMLWPF